MNLLLLDLGAIWQQAQFSACQSGTTITGEEERSKRFSTVKKEEDIIVSFMNFHKFNSLEQLKAINRVRIGEENEVLNLVDYLTNTTVRE